MKHDESGDCISFYVLDLYRQNIFLSFVGHLNLFCKQISMFFS